MKNIELRKTRLEIARRIGRQVAGVSKNGENDIDQFDQLKSVVGMHGVREQIDDDVVRDKVLEKQVGAFPRQIIELG